MNGRGHAGTLEGLGPFLAKRGFPENFSSEVKSKEIGCRIHFAADEDLVLVKGGRAIAIPYFCVRPGHDRPFGRPEIL